MSDSDVRITITVDASGAQQGADQARSALAGVAPQIQAVGKTFEDLGRSLKGGVAGLGDLGKAISGVGQAGARLGAVGDGMAGAASAIGQAALAAASATADWAQKTANSTTATAEARQAATNLNNAVGAANLAFGAVGDTLAEAFAPALTRVVQTLAGFAQGLVVSYREGGTARTVVDTLVEGFRLLASGAELAVRLVVAIIVQVRGQARLWKDEFQVVRDSVVGRLTEIGGEFRSLGVIFRDVLSGDFSRAAADFSRGLQQMRDQSASTVTAVQADLAKVAATENQLASERAGALTADFAAYGRHGGARPAAGSGPSQSPLARAPAGAVRASGAPPPAVAPASLGVDQAATTQQQLTEIAARGVDERTRDELKAIADQLAATRAQTAEQIAAVQARAAAGRISATEASAQVAALRQQDVEAERRAADQEYQVRLQALQRKLALEGEAHRSTVDEQASIESLTAQHLAQLTRLNAEALKQQDDDRRASLAKFRQAWDATINPLISSFNNGLLQMAEGTKSFSQVFRSLGQQVLNQLLRVVDQMVETWAWGVAENVVASAQGQALLDALGLRGFAQSVALQSQRVAVATAGERLSTAAAAQGAAQRQSITAAAAVKDLTASAAQAAGDAYKAMAGVPIVGPALGAAAASAAFGAVLAFRGLVSAAGGFDIPSGVNPIAQLHQEEMVLPARLANPLRDLLASQSAAGPGGAGLGHSISFGDFHVHGAPTGMSPAQFRQALADHATHVAGAVAGALRGGWRPSYGQPTGAL